MSRGPVEVCDNVFCRDTMNYDPYRKHHHALPLALRSLSFIFDIKGAVGYYIYYRDVEM